MLIGTINMVSKEKRNHHSFSATHNMNYNTDLPGYYTNLYNRDKHITEVNKHLEIGFKF